MPSSDSLWPITPDVKDTLSDKSVTPITNYNERLRDTDINEIIHRIVTCNTCPASDTLSVTKCNSNIDMIVSDNGAICPICNVVLKNRTTLSIHMKRCGKGSQGPQGPQGSQRLQDSQPPSLNSGDGIKLVIIGD